MKKFPPIGSRMCALAAATAVLASVSIARAHPYASGITVSGGNVNFILNEDADSVKVAFDSNTVTNDLGALAKGAHSFALGSHTDYSIIVYKVGSGAPSVISEDTNRFVNFYGPRGVAVNRNPKGANFGRIYVVSAAGGSTPIGGYGTTYGYGSRTLGRGIYILNADQSDAVGQGDTALTAGMTLGSSTTVSPYKISVGPDDMVYVGDGSGTYWGGTGNGVYMAQPDFSSGTALFNLGDTTMYGGVNGTPVAFGSLAAGTLVLYAVEQDMAPYQTVWQYNIGGTVPATTATAPPTAICNAGISSFNGVGTDMAIGPDGKIYTLEYRITPAADSIPLRVFDAAGNPLWDSWNNWGATYGDPYNYEYGIAISDDGKMMATMIVNGKFAITRLTNGIPDPSTFTVFGPTWNDMALSSSSRGIAFDAADNVYLSSGGLQMMRVCSLGMTTTAITHNDATGMNGTFELLLPPATASVTATVPNASQSGPTPGVFTLTRTGDLNLPLAVRFTLEGTATNGVYTCSPAGIDPVATNTITFAAGQASADVTITPVNDGVARPTTTVVITLLSGAGYSATAPSSDTIYIQNTATPQIVVSAGAATMYKPMGNDFATVTLTRLGDTNAAAFTVSSFTYGGTAVAGVDFVTAQPVTFNPGVVTATATVQNVPHARGGVYTGNKTIVVGLTSGSGYTAGAGTATMTILDDAYPPAEVLWSNPLTDSADANNWNVTGVSRDGTAPDYTPAGVEFGCDLTGTGPYGAYYGVIPLPPNGATTALRVACAENSGIAGAVNLYPTNVSFSGDYAMRFNMYLVQNSALGNATEGAMFGINHDGMETNWWLGAGTLVGGPWSSDGVWYWVDADAGGAGFGDYVEMTGAANQIPNSGWQKLDTQYWTSFQNAFKNPAIFTTVNSASNGVPGMPANASSLLGLTTTGNWADVEVKQVNNVVTLSINKTPIFVYNNATVFTNGTIMLGFEDPFDGSGGTYDAAAYFSNLRVVRLGPPSITEIAPGGNNMVINFTSVDGDDTTDSFALQSAGTVTGPYQDVSASFTQLGSGAFQATVAKSGDMQFYRIRHK